MLFTSALVVAVTSFIGLTSAQSTTNVNSQRADLTKNATGVYPFTVDPNTVPINTRQTWCTAQMNSCPYICNGRAYPNTCNATTLDFECLCTAYNTTPNITGYLQTVPYYTCVTNYAQCINASGSNLDQQNVCLSIPCGSIDPVAAAASASASSSAGASSTSRSAASSTAASAAASTTTRASGASATYVPGFLAMGALAIAGAAL